MLRFIFYSLVSLSTAALAVAAAILWYVVSQLPSVESLREVRLQTPMRVYTSDAKLIAEFGEKRRVPATIADVPVQLKQAFIAAEDNRFYQHHGVDWMAIVRAAMELVQTREKKRGGSTITMQVARNFFLSPEKTYERKLKEIVLAVIIERQLSKDEILELYLNKIFLGHRAYGVGAAAQVYYGAKMHDLDLPQMALIAGLPKAPSRDNPISNPARARDRRAYVLGRMFKLGFIDAHQFAQAEDAPITATPHGQPIEVLAPHLAEMVRDKLLERYGEAAYTQGLVVHTTVAAALQGAARTALRQALVDYDRRHGYRGAEARAELAADAGLEAWAAALEAYSGFSGLIPAIVVATDTQKAIVDAKNRGALTLPWEGIQWAREHLSADARGPRPKTAGEVLSVGDIIRIEWHRPEPEPDAADAPVAAGYWRLAQLPQVQGALVSLNPNDGAVQALVGGLNYYRSKFNRVTQALRQPGSNFKPFIYSAALDKGFTAASFINDAPIVFDAPGLESAWRPENYSGKYHGPTRLREALIKSRNLVSIRLLRRTGVAFTRNYVSRFGFDVARLPNNLSMSLGTGELTPMEVVTGYAVLANGGYKVQPYFVQRIESGDGETLFEADPKIVCAACENVALDEEGEPLDIAALMEMEALPPKNRAPRVVGADNAWIMNSIMQDVIKRGTGQRARALKRKDLAGKTGTTNDQKDAWFSGFNRNIVTTAWVGFDQVASLGQRETGAQAALPMWIDYMRVALEGQPETQLERPPGVITVRIDPDTGSLAGADNPNAIFESFREGSVPPRAHKPGSRGPYGSNPDVVPEQLF